MVDVLFQLTSDLHATTPTFTLTCVSNGGPVTYVNWTRDGIPVPQDRYHLASHTLVNAHVATYHSTLSITGRLPGLYRCEVSSVRPDRTVMDTQNLDIVGEFVLHYMAEPCTIINIHLIGIETGGGGGGHRGDVPTPSFQSVPHPLFMSCTTN